MFSDSYSFPHPVLGVADDIEGEFNFSVCIERRGEERVVYFKSKKLEIKNDYISKLVNEGYVDFVLSIYCGATYQSWVSYGTDDSFIPEDQLASRIEVQPLLVTRKDIPNYYDKSFNSDYEQNHFSLVKSEIVGVSGKKVLPIEKIDERLGFGSIFKWKQTDAEKSVEYYLESDQIEITYPVKRDNDDPISYLFKIKPWTSYSIFILPALEEAFRYMKDAKGSAERFDWYWVLSELLPEDERTPSPFVNAQRVIKDFHPLQEVYFEH